MWRTLGEKSAFKRKESIDDYVYSAVFSPHHCVHAKMDLYLALGQLYSIFGYNGAHWSVSKPKPILSTYSNFNQLKHS